MLFPIDQFGRQRGALDAPARRMPGFEEARLQQIGPGQPVLGQPAAEATRSSRPSG
jgi:hypothetical protein